MLTQLVKSAGRAVAGMFSQGKPETPAPKDAAMYSVLNLHRSVSAQDLIGAHLNVQTWYMPQRTMLEKLYDFMRPETMWDEEEKAELRRKKKPVVAFMRLKSSERAFIGNMLLQKYEMKAAPAEPSDQNISDVITVLYKKVAHDNSVRYRDIGLLRDAWVGGSAWQESYVEVGPGRKPRIVIRNQNNFAIYPDPCRRDLVTNSDCRFIDRKGWYYKDDLISAYPDKQEIIEETLPNATSITYQQDGKPWADRQHEQMQQRNGQHAVVERFYRVWKRRYDSIDLKTGKKSTVGHDFDAAQREEWKAQNPGATLCSEPEEFLYLAVACYGVSEYLYNGPYHVQPRNPKTGRIMFPLLELVDEDVGGVPTGHMEHMVGPQKAINAMAVNTIAQAKAAGGVPLVGDSDAFDEDAQDDIGANISDGPRVFWKKKGAPKGSGLTPVSMGATGPDTQKTLNFAEQVLEDNSSMPPAMKGMAEGNVPAALNEQRVQQAAAQSMVAVANYQNFLMQRAILWCCYFAEYWDFQDVVRVVEKSDPNGPDYITINELVQDAWGNITRRNNLKDLLNYDIVFEESWQSPSMREDTRRQIAKIMESGAVKGDPVLSSFLQYYFVLLTDAPQDFKNFFREHSQVIQAQEKEKQTREAAGQGLEHARNLMDLADREASAAVPTPPPPPRGRARVPEYT